MSSLFESTLETVEYDAYGLLISIFVLEFIGFYFNMQLQHFMTPIPANSIVASLNIAGIFEIIRRYHLKFCTRIC